ncbi:sel1 repeat family protein [Microbulbifer sp. CAU 1566]|uniref:tetratricopeptide repeat protein n=1 Tax=Microbulbifer sp. CAU 1566 TaxID=2933269 RepID=UPI002006C52E|nr:tetratricopeptide repeat protein [Microbulbifer sp. CAU 1566]MCK7595826.1 sel1 repeat family protein [Microbulbifer sp. CAU 1566]
MSPIEKARKYWRLGEDRKAIDTLDVAELATSAEALFLLGDIYNCADSSAGGGRQSYSRARKYWLEALQYGSMEAAVELGDLYYFGNGVKQDFGKVEHYWQIAASAGDETGMHKLADLYCEHMPEKIHDAIAYLQSLTYGSSFADHACYRLGKIYNRGIGVSRNPEVAASWFEAGAKANHGHCLLDLAFLLYKGDGVVKNVTRAIQLAERAAETEWLKDLAPVFVEQMRSGTLLH